jgi:hypothetical protein
MAMDDVVKNFVERGRRAQAAIDSELGAGEPLFVIWSIEHNGWWRPREIGYCETLAEAGRYPRARAAEIVKRANIVKFHECMIPVECLDGWGR